MKPPTKILPPLGLVLLGLLIAYALVLYLKKPGPPPRREKPAASVEKAVEAPAEAVVKSPAPAAPRLPAVIEPKAVAPAETPAPGPAVPPDAEEQERSPSPTIKTGPQETTLRPPATAPPCAAIPPVPYRIPEQPADQPPAVVSPVTDQAAPPAPLPPAPCPETGIPGLTDDTWGFDWQKNYGIMADKFHRMLSRRLISSANWVDSFFREERTEIEENETSLRLRLSSFAEETEGIKPDVKLRLNLVLPGLEDKVHIMLSGDRNEDRDFDKDPMSRVSEIDEEAVRNVNLSLRYFIKAARDKNLSFKVGARVSDFSPVIYWGPRFRISKRLDTWLTRFTQEVKYFSDDGWEVESDFDFEKDLADDLFFRTSLEGTWYENEDGYFYDVHFALYKIIDEDRVLGYLWSNYFETEVHHQLNQVVLALKYRQRLKRKWLFFEIKPQVAFREADNFNPTIGVTVAVEALFGYRGRP